jgi:23S rRNA pseudouridine955/2504/2580 synthase
MSSTDATIRRTAPVVSHVEVGAEAAGQRLDNFLLSALRGVPRSHVYQLIRSGQVRVNSGRSTARYRVQRGDSIRIPPIRKPARAPQPPPDGLEWLEQRIAYEDSRLLLLDKPAGLAVHGGSGVALGCIEGLRSLRPNLKTLELVHRLDRATSGCLLVAKRRSTLRTLHALLRSGYVEKRYLALVMGRWPQGTTRIDAPLATVRRGGEARVRVDASGKVASSEFRLLDALAGASFVEISIGTGRTHQIRVHAAHAGHPIAGDDRYGDREFNAGLAGRGLSRMFLHAHSIAFEWPDSGEPFALSLPLPDDLKRVLDTLGKISPRRSPAGRDRRRAGSRRPRSAADRRGR